jgi:hypothetical protein
VFYIGKGKGERCLDHLYEDDDHPKVQRIRDIFTAGLEPRIEVLAHGMATSDEAYLVEAAAIDLIGLKELTNKVVGHNSLLYGRKSIKELEVFYAPMNADIPDPVVLIRISELNRNGMTATLTRAPFGPGAGNWPTLNYAGGNGIAVSNGVVDATGLQAYFVYQGEYRLLLQNPNSNGFPSLGNAYIS